MFIELKIISKPFDKVFKYCKNLGKGNGSYLCQDHGGTS